MDNLSKREFEALGGEDVSDAKLPGQVLLLEEIVAEQALTLEELLAEMEWHRPGFAGEGAVLCYLRPETVMRMKELVRTTREKREQNGGDSRAEIMIREDYLSRWPHMMVACPHCGREARVHAAQHGEWVTVWNCACGAGVLVKMHMEMRLREPPKVTGMK